MKLIVENLKTKWGQLQRFSRQIGPLISSRMGFGRIGHPNGNMHLSPQKTIQILKKIEEMTLNDYQIQICTLTTNLASIADRDSDIIDFVAEKLGPKFRPFISLVHSVVNDVLGYFHLLIIGKIYFLDIKIQ